MKRVADSDVVVVVITSWMAFTRDLVNCIISHYSFRQAVRHRRVSKMWCGVVDTILQGSLAIHDPVRWRWLEETGRLTWRAANPLVPWESPEDHGKQVVRSSWTLLHSHIYPPGREPPCLCHFCNGKSQVYARESCRRPGGCPIDCPDLHAVTLVCTNVGCGIVRDIARARGLCVCARRCRKCDTNLQCTCPCRIYGRSACHTDQGCVFIFTAMPFLDQRPKMNNNSF